MRRASDRIDADLGGILALEVELAGASETELAELADWARTQPEVRWVGAGTGGAWQRQGGIARISIHTPDIGGRAFAGLAERVQQRGRAIEDATVVVTGTPLVAYTGVNRIATRLRTSLVGLLLVVTVVLGVALRSIRLAVVAVPVNVLPLLVGGACLAWLGQTLDPLAAVIVAVALGIAVDDTLHLTARTLEERRAGRSPDDAVLAAAEHSGRALVVTTVALAAGLSVAAPVVVSAAAIARRPRHHHRRDRPRRRSDPVAGAARVHAAATMKPPFSAPALLPSRVMKRAWVVFGLCGVLACGDDAGDDAAGSSTGDAATGDTGMPTTAGSSGGGTLDGSTGEPGTGDSTDATGDGTETGSMACATPRECADENEAATAAYLETIRDDPKLLDVFLVEMPLGGDLHHHLSGGVYAETYLGWALADGDFCIQTSGLSLSTSCGDGNDVPVPTGRRELYLDVVRAWSMFQFEPGPSESGADHFFATFSKFGAISGTRHGSMLADIRSRAAGENLQYIEPMLTSNSVARSLGQDVWAAMGGGAMTESDYPDLHAAILADSGFFNARDFIVEDVEDSEAIADSEQDCGSGSPDAGCDVETRYQAYISRSGSDAGIFGQMVAAYEAAAIEPRLVGLNLVGPEYGSTAMANYDRLMAMLGYLQGAYAGMSPLRLSLHAGEISESTIPGGYSLDEEDHIRQAVEVAGARRVGHGMDVMFESDPQGLLDMLREQDVLVEVCLASNDIILEVSGPSHPVHDYIEAGVPVALGTDDQGVARSSPAAEYARAVADQDLDYYELKAMARAEPASTTFLEGARLLVRKSRALQERRGCLLSPRTATRR